jgi:hypothetical protein
MYLEVFPEVLLADKGFPSLLTILEGLMRVIKKSTCPLLLEKSPAEYYNGSHSRLVSKPNSATVLK